MRIYYKSPYHYTVRMKSRGKVKEDNSGTNQKERKATTPQASEIVITKVNLDLLQG